MEEVLNLSSDGILNDDVIELTFGLLVEVSASYLCSQSERNVLLSYSFVFVTHSGL